MRPAAILLILFLSGCIGYARGDGSGNVEVVTNWGTLGGQSAESAAEASE
jgi:hypothetical protein